MTSPEFDADAWLLEELKAAHAESLAIPAGALEVAKASFTWRLIDEEFETLALCFDSAVDEGALELVRAPAANAPRSLSFENDEFGVEIVVHADRLIGQLLPPQPGEVRMMAAHGLVSRATADTAGCFSLTRPPAGLMRLEFSIDTSPIATEWVAL